MHFDNKGTVTTAPPSTAGSSTPKKKQLVGEILGNFRSALYGNVENCMIKY